MAPASKAHLEIDTSASQMGRRTLNCKKLFLLTGALLGAAVVSAQFMTAAVAQSDSPAGTSQTGAAKDRITILYDAFGRDPSMMKDWGFSALIEVGGKRILFDTGNDSSVFGQNVKGRGVDLSKLDFVVMSHRHGDHMGGLNYLLSVNPNVPIYAPKENFGVFGSSLPGTFYRRNEALPSDMRYFGGEPPEALHFGTPWPQGKFTWVSKSIEVASGFHLILLKGSWGVDLDVMEVSLAIDTPEGTVLVVGCSHPTIEKIVEAAQAETHKPIRLIVGGLHLLPAKDDEIQRIGTALRDTLKVAWIAPGHCTGEPAFAILKKIFGDHYLYAGLGTTVALDSIRNAQAREHGSRVLFDRTDRITYSQLSRFSSDVLHADARSR